MSSHKENLKLVQKYLIIDEPVLQSHRVKTIRFSNVVISFTLLLSFLIVLPITLDFRGLWIVFSIGQLFFTFFYLSQIQKNQLYFVTRFRIIVIEEANFVQKIFKLHGKLAINDYHYSHVEVIRLGSPEYSANRMWMGMFLLAIGWAISVSQNTIFRGDSPLLPLVILLYLLGIVNILIALPIRGSLLQVMTISGKTLSLPAKELPEEFVADLIDSCRTFQTHGAE